MPSPGALVETIGAVAESRVAKEVIERAASLAHEAWSPRRVLKAADIGVAEQESGLKRSLHGIVDGYKPAIPETLASPDLLKAEKGQIASALNAERDRMLAIRLHQSSQSWGSSEYINFNPRVGGTNILPTIEFTTQRPAGTALGAWSNGRVKLGDESFLSPLTPTKAGTAVHEITHHEQGFLIMCRRADQLGFTSAATPKDALLRLTAEVKSASHLNFTESIAKRFMDFRAGRQLTVPAAERADQLTQSFKGLFERPSELYGNNIQARMNRIQGYQSVLEDPKKIEEVKSVLQKLQSSDDGEKIAREIFSGHVASAEREALLAKMPAGAASDWSEASMIKGRDVFGDALASAHTNESRLQRAWNRDYTGSLHEREARFNQYIAETSLRAHLKESLVANDKFWLPVNVNL